MERSLIKKRAKGLLSFALALVMVTGTGVYSKAESNTVEIIATTTESSPYDKPADVTNSEANGQSQEAVLGNLHVHDFKWTVTVQPVEGKDGKCEAICWCGAVNGVQSVSYFRIVIKSILESIEGAPQNGTVTINNSYLRCLTDEIMEALHKRSDVSLQVEFTEAGQNYKTIIPAGKAPTGEKWYGYFYLGSLFGWQ